jgi:uncharacterized protein (DUF1501 family)
MPTFPNRNQPSLNSEAVVADVANRLTKRGQLSRRDFVKIAGLIGGGHLLATQLGPLRHALATTVAPSPGATDGILVLIYLNGGNDGMNTVIPLGAQESAYRALRPKIGVTNPLMISTDTGLHPSLANLSTRFANNQVAVLRNVGYNPPNLSHFTSQDHWAEGAGAGGPVFTANRTGWLGRWYDGAENGNPFKMIGVGGVPLYVRGASAAALGLPVYSTPSIGNNPSDPEEKRLGDAFRTMAATTGFGQYGDKLGVLGARAFTAASGASSSYVGLDGRSNLSMQLSLTANLINANLGTRVFTAQLQGFDTHGDQPTTHAELLSDFDQSVEMFLQRLQPAQRTKVTILTWSEFGRRPEENNSLGTDHGAASCMFAIGEPVMGGIYGSAPDLTTFDSDGDLIADTDFRQIYASALSGVLGADDSAILRGDNVPVKFLRSLLPPPPTTTTTTTTTTSTTTSTTTTTIAATTTTLAPASTVATVPTSPTTSSSTQPATTQPATTQPVATQPTQPSTTQASSTTAQPATTQPTAPQATAPQTTMPAQTPATPASSAPAATQATTPTSSPSTSSPTTTRGTNPSAPANTAPTNATYPTYPPSSTVYPTSNAAAPTTPTIASATPVYVVVPAPSTATTAEAAAPVSTSPASTTPTIPSTSATTSSTTIARPVAPASTVPPVATSTKNPPLKPKVTTTTPTIPSKLSLRSIKSKLKPKPKVKKKLTTKR